MNDDRLIRRLQVVDAPSMPREEFIEDLHGRLSAELARSGPDGVRIERLASRRRKGRIGLTLLAAAALVGLSLIGSGLAGRYLAVEPNRSQLPAVLATASPSALLSPKESPDVSATDVPAPFAALRGTGLLLFENNNPRLNVRLEYLQPNGLGKELLPDLRGNQETPAWSPDGKHLAFGAWDPKDAAAQEQIWETDAAGASPRLLTVDCKPPKCRDELWPAYSPDGGRLAFVRFAGALGGPPTSSVVAIRDLATGDTTELDSTRVNNADAFVEHPRWSPDGNRLVYSRVAIDATEKATDSIVFVVDRDGGNLRPLTDPGFAAGDPEWSPDGSRILLAREPIHHWLEGKSVDRNAVIYTVAPDGSELTKLTSKWSGAASWAAAGSQILYTVVNFSMNGGQFEVISPDIYVMDADGSNQTKVQGFSSCCRWYPVQQPTP